MMRWDILFPLVRVRTRLIPDMQAAAYGYAFVVVLLVVLLVIGGFYWLSPRGFFK
ncbi:hypothetical protein AAG663_08795 [Bacillus licheniformis]